MVSVPQAFSPRRSNFIGVARRVSFSVADRFLGGTAIMGLVQIATSSAQTVENLQRQMDAEHRNTGATHLGFLLFANAGWRWYNSTNTNSTVSCGAVL